MKSATIILAENFMREVNLTASTIAKQVNLPPSSLRGVLRGEARLSSLKEAEILTVASKLAKYARALDPLLLPADESDLRDLLNTDVEPERVRELVATIFGRE